MVIIIGENVYVMIIDCFDVMIEKVKKNYECLGLIDKVILFEG